MKNGTEGNGTTNVTTQATLNEQLAQLLEGARAEGMIVAGVVADPRSVERMKLFSSIGERQAVDLFAAIVKTYNKGKVGRKR